MNDFKISGRALNALAAVLHELRPDWHEPGILDALAKARDSKQCRDGWHLALAAIRCAAEASNRTPRVITLEGKHWEERVREPERKITTGAEVKRCTTGCGRTYSEPDSEHDCAPRAEAGSRARALAREAAAEARGDYERAMAERAEAQAGAA